MEAMLLYCLLSRLIHRMTASGALRPNNGAQGTLFNQTDRLSAGS